jgi:hypothetical protein
MDRLKALLSNRAFVLAVQGLALGAAGKTLAPEQFDALVTVLQASAGL